MVEIKNDYCPEHERTCLVATDTVDPQFFECVEDLMLFVQEQRLVYVKRSGGVFLYRRVKHEIEAPKSRPIEEIRIPI